jgi:hypothetical protein
MSRDNLESLLDAMLDESAVNVAADAEREREARERAAREKQKKAVATRSAEAPTLTEIAALTGLPDGDLRKVLAKAAPDDLLVVLATSADALQRRILLGLSADSVKWLKENLAHIDVVSNAEREGAEKKLLKVANTLLRAGEIGLPEPESIGKDDAPDAAEKDLRDLLTDLVRIAGQAGPDALAAVLESSDEPLLVAGLGIIGEADGDVRRALAKKRAELEVAYAQRLLLIEEALVAIAEGEPADAFRARLFK